MNRFFKKAGDLDSDKHKSVMNKAAIEEYLLTIVSGKKYDYECELGTLCGGGKTIVSFDRVKEMVDLGYNIISAKCINVNMIEVEYQQFRKNNLGKVR